MITLMLTMRTTVKCQCMTSFEVCYPCTGISWFSLFCNSAANINFMIFAYINGHVYFWIYFLVVSFFLVALFVIFGYSLLYCVTPRTSEAEEHETTCYVFGLSLAGQIPDASLIHLARKRRQLARERGDEFIPVDSSSAAREKKSSRLIRWLSSTYILSLLLS